MQRICGRWKNSISEEIFKKKSTIPKIKKVFKKVKIQNFSNKDMKNYIYIPDSTIVLEGLVCIEISMIMNILIYKK